MQYTVKKPINNNILRVVDPTGCELIVTGRGLGFGVKPAEVATDNGGTHQCNLRLLLLEEVDENVGMRS